MRYRRRRLTLVALALALAAGTAAGCDLVRPGRVCTRELRVDLRPPEQTITVGQTFTATVELSSCGGQERLSDSFTWQAQDPAIVEIDAAAGRITGKAPGETLVEVSGRKYGRVGAVRVTVTAVGFSGRHVKPPPPAA
jgi:outer membrane biogenesis lipoprotein LolB